MLIVPGAANEGLTARVAALELSGQHHRRAAIPVAIAYNLFLDRFISGITGGAVK